MNKLAALLVLVLLCAIVPVNAQPKPISKEDKLKGLSEELKLNSAQVKEIQKILGASEERIERINEQQRKLMDELRNINNEDDQQIIKLLNKDQKQKFEKIKKERDKKPPMDMDKKPRGQKPEYEPGK